MKQQLSVPYVDLVSQHAEMKEELLDAIGDVLDHGKFILGQEVEEFEGRFAELCGVRHAVGLNSGTDALILTLKALGIGHGDEVITAPNSFIASAGCIALVGAVPVFVDVGDDYNIDPTLIEAALTPRTRAIIPVHLTGRPADMDPITSIASAHNLDVIEDAAQAVTAQYKGRPVGSLGSAGCFSLHPLKTLNACGDGGVMTTDDPDIFRRVSLARNLGLKTREEATIWSSNSRLDTIQAAILLVKLRYLNDWTEKRRVNARYYQQHLADVAQVQVPLDEPYERAVYHTFVVQADSRDALSRYLGDRGIGTGIHYPIPIHLQEAASHLGYGPGSFPVVEQHSQRILSLPVHHGLGEADTRKVVAAIREFYLQEARS